MRFKLLFLSILFLSCKKDINNITGERDYVDDNAVSLSIKGTIFTGIGDSLNIDDNYAFLFSEGDFVDYNGSARVQLFSSDFQSWVKFQIGLNEDSPSVGFDYSITNLIRENKLLVIGTGPYSFAPQFGIPDDTYSQNISDSVYSYNYDRINGLLSFKFSYTNDVIGSESNYTLRGTVRLKIYQLTY